VVIGLLCFVRRAPRGAIVDGAADSGRPAGPPTRPQPATRPAPGTGGSDFDLVTLHQNIYYFPVESRTPLLAHLAGFLRPGGRLLITSICRGGGVATAGLDLWGAMTDGAGRLPDPHELGAQLAAAGYHAIRSIKITPDGMYWAFVATNG